MKKYLYLALLAIACGALFTACEPNTPSNGGQNNTDYSTLDSITVKCWEYTLVENGKTATLYAWCTEKMLVMNIEKEVAEAKKQGSTWTYTYKPSDITDMDACIEKNNEGADCWKITVTKDGKSTTIYMFTTEDCAELYAQTEAGSTGKYELEKAEPTDPDACEELNDNQGGGGQGGEDPKKGACYKITQGSPGQTYTYYYWYDDMDEEKMQLSKEIAEAQGLVFEWEIADAADESSCLALNNNQGGGGEGDTYACYQVTSGGNTMYYWTTENILKNQFGSNEFVVWQKADADDEDACEALNGAESCWKLTLTNSGQSSTSYMWATESQIQATVDAYRQMMPNITITVEPASANDEDSCYALNNY